MIHRISGTPSHLAFDSQQSHPHAYESQTQTQEILTQNPDLTQLGDFEEDGDLGELSPLPPYSPAAQQTLPWGRMVPCSKHGGKGIDLLPRPPAASVSNNNNNNRRNYMNGSGGVGVSCLGLDNLLPSDIFNEYLLGRRSKCDVLAVKPPDDDDDDDDNDNAAGAGAGAEKDKDNKRSKALQEWAYGMISNQHAKIYCTLDSSKAAVGNVPNIEVYVEDTSGNGTLINKTTLLRRGEKRLLHSGDEVCFVNPQTLRKKIRSNAVLQDLLQHYSFVFIKHQAGFPSLHATVMGRPRLSTSSCPSSSGKRKSAVDVRSLKLHSLVAPSNSKASAVSRLSSPSPFSFSQDSSSQAQRRKSTGSRRISPRRQQPRRVEEDYDIRDLLGSGTVGEVRRAIHRQTGEERAVKIIAVGGRNRANTFLEADASSTFQAEAAILQGMEHPYVVKLIDVYVSPRAVYLIMELLHGGDLFDRIVEKGKYSEVQGRQVMRRLLSAVYYLHEERNIVHRDLKPENILCVNHENDVEVKLTDFGLAKAINGEDGLKTFCGTPQYFAPEVLRRRNTVAGRGRYGKQADMWSLGVVLYVLLSGTPPFDVGQGFDVVGDAKIEFPEEHWAGVSEKARDLVRCLLVTDPRKRVSVLQACKHEWIMTDDGDTHVYPLDDPKVSVSKKRLFPLTGGNEDIVTPPEEAVYVDVDAGMTDTVAENKAPALSAKALPEQKESNNGIMDSVADAGIDSESTKVSPNVAEKEAGPNAHLEPQQETPKSQASVAPVDSIDRPEPQQQTPKSQASVAPVYSIDRPVFSPLSLNKGWAKSAQSAYSTLPEDAEVSSKLLDDIDEPPKDAESFCKDDHVPVENRCVSDENAAANAVTPSASNKTQAGQSADEYISGYQIVAGAELSDDEICSQFSDRTESISGRSGSVDEGMTDVAEAKTVVGGNSLDRPSIFGNFAASLDPNRPETRDGSSSAGQSKKRRVTDAADERMSKLEPNKTLKTRNNGSVRAQEQSDSSSDTASDVQQCTKTAVQGHGGGKQTTLSSWFKKSA
jgi:serine/threonine protein kinase